LISETALKEQKIAHAFGSVPSRAHEFAPLISQMIEKLGITELLDYGCGKGELIPHLKSSHEFKIQLYDPAVDEYAGKALPMQMVVCIDVLEHVESEYVAPVLNDLERVTGAVLFLSVKEGEFKDWIDSLMDKFEVQTIQVLPEGFYAICYAKPQPLVEVVSGTA